MADIAAGYPTSAAAAATSGPPARRSIDGMGRRVDPLPRYRGQGRARRAARARRVQPRSSPVQRQGDAGAGGDIPDRGVPRPRGLVAPLPPAAVSRRRRPAVDHAIPDRRRRQRPGPVRLDRVVGRREPFLQLDARDRGRGARAPLDRAWTAQLLRSRRRVRGVDGDRMGNRRIRHVHPLLAGARDSLSGYLGRPDAGDAGWGHGRGDRRADGPARDREYVPSGSPRATPSLRRTTGRSSSATHRPRPEKTRPATSRPCRCGQADRSASSRPSFRPARSCAGLPTKPRPPSALEQAGSPADRRHKPIWSCQRCAGS